MNTTDTLERARIGTAHRVTMKEARRHFAAGGTVLVSEYGHELEHPVYPGTNVHTSETIGWDDLAGMVTMWRNRYPGQRFYLVTYPASVCTFPPARMPAETVRPGDVLPMCGTVSTVDTTDPRRTLVRFRPEAARSFGRIPIAGEVMFYPGELVHVSREVTR